MLKFVGLIQNENMKIISRIGTWVMAGLLMLAVIGFAVVSHFNQPAETPGEDWKENLAQVNQENREILKSPEVAGFYRSQLEKEIAINQHRLDENIPPADQTVWGFVIDAIELTSLITLFTIIVAATSVAGEFSWGTIKLLLIRAVSRSKVLLSKYAATFLYALALLILLFVTSFAAGGILFGLGEVSTPHLAYENGQVVERNMLLHILGLFGFASVKLLMMVTFAFMISTVFRSSSLAIGLSIFLMFAGTQATYILSQLGHDWVKYILFANTELSVYFDGNPLVSGMTLGFSLTILAIHFILFQAVSWISFLKRDITA
ncbi:ABC transporter permease [Desmospora profundinema]|uniref:ABC-2 type transport system permease protein n=1 Tax=Desmospora profundinema TaxID=1571184 RepID=A0ABU1ILL2_9BACL|nr:ABC transporter permease [Desmospora profundinema]MDR6225303.1 ABC-2 type transport system permease protein [Desmospora profundinema]